MLKDLRKYEYLGTPDFYFYLSKQIVKIDSLEEQDILALFANKSISGRMDFKGSLEFAKLINLIIIDDKTNIVTLDPSFNECLVSREYFKNKILERTFNILRVHDEFHLIFNSKNTSYDIVYNKVQISNSAFKFIYANFKQLLIDFEFISPHPDLHIRQYIVNGKYKKLFDKIILPAIKDKKLGLDELKKQIEMNNIYGEEAEEYVLLFEKKRLDMHKHINNIEKISDYYVNAGYDIISFDSVESEELDRHIEVKSFTGEESFFWSRNEIEVARIKKDEYFLYLVDRSKMNNKDYEPTIIQNPYEEVLNKSEWKRRIEKYFISKL